MNFKRLFSDEVQSILSDDNWLIPETEYDENVNLQYESLFTLTSGRMGNRGVHEEGDVRKTLPANYLHGVFDQSEAFQRELCNTPDWTKVKLFYRCEQIGLESGVCLEEYIRVLDMKKGILAKHYITTSKEGRRTQIETIKFLSRKHPRCGCIKILLTPLNYDGTLEVENIIDATVTNFQDFPRFRVKHLTTLEVAKLEKGCFVLSETRDDKMKIGTAAHVLISDIEGNDLIKSRSFKPYGEVACEFMDVDIRKNNTIVIKKFASICSEKYEEDLKRNAIEDLRYFTETSFSKILNDHMEEYKKMWDIAEIEVVGNEDIDKALKFNIFHLMSTPNFNDSTTSIGAKLLHGEEYGGHAFWDNDIFILPFFIFVFPEIAKNLVEYRYKLLDAAIENAKQTGYKGARYPWESADTGEEVCPTHTIEPDGTCYPCKIAEHELHITAAVAYGVMNYVEKTMDKDFFYSKGIYILVRSAEFWISRLEYNVEKDYYEMTKVTGPDEWHEAIDNNFYTNYLARWNIYKAIEQLTILKNENLAIYKKVMDDLEFNEKNLSIWKGKADNIYISNTSGLIEQFDNYFDLEDSEINEWDANGMPILPKSLEKIPKSQRCILKQPDVVMLMYLMEHDFDFETQRINYDYYEKRTLHRSSLSPSINTLMALRIGDVTRAYQYLLRSIFVDLHNLQGNTREGIHAASTGGTWQSIVFGYGGMTVNKNGQLSFKPRLNNLCEELRFSIKWKGDTLRIRITKEDVFIINENRDKKIMYFVNDEKKMSGLCDDV